MQSNLCTSKKVAVANEFYKCICCVSSPSKIAVLSYTDKIEILWYYTVHGCDGGTLWSEHFGNDKHLVSWIAIWMYIQLPYWYDSIRSIFKYHVVIISSIFTGTMFYPLHGKEYTICKWLQVLLLRMRRLPFFGKA